MKGATKKGQSTIQAEALSEQFTEWLIDLKGTIHIWRQPFVFWDLFELPSPFHMHFVPQLGGIYLSEPTPPSNLTSYMNAPPPEKGLVSDEEQHAAAPSGK